MDFLQLLGSIDWIFAFVLLIGGRYWGRKYFKVCEKPDLNFLLFATIFGLIWLTIQHLMGDLSKAHAGNIFLTYLFTTSFYQILAKRLFEWVETKFSTNES